MATRRYRCGYCGEDGLKRSDVLPPIGAARPPGEPWRCRPCHSGVLRGE